MPEAGNNRTNGRKLKYLLIIGALVVISLVVLPTLSILPPEEQQPAQEAPQLIQTEEASEEELASCASLNSEVQSIFGIDIANRNNLTSAEVLERRLATDLLIGEFCNRPNLIREIVPVSEPGINLIAYACDAAKGLLGDKNLQQSLAHYSQVYCNTADSVIATEADYLLEGVNGFRLYVLPTLEQSNSTDSSGGIDGTNTIDESTDPASDTHVRAVESKMEKIIETITYSKTLLNSGTYYEAAKSLEEASTLFAQLIAEEAE
jgi:hypothetical protein